MIPKEFKKTTINEKEYNNFMTQFEYEEIQEELKHLPPLEEQRKEYEESPEYKLQEKIIKSFNIEYKKLTEASTYFLGCTYHSYTTNYDNRLKAFKDLYIDAEEHNFIIDELNLIKSYNFSFFIEDNLKKNIKYSMEKTNHFLMEKLKKLGYNIENTTSKEGKINSIAIKGSSVIKLDNEPIVDLSDSKPIDKIRSLGLIGFFDYIKEREPDLNINQIASLISMITGINPLTVQPYINPILSTDVSQKKNPLENKRKVAEVKKQLINIGIKNFNTL
jgi:hypothetical protein